jgi:hypothetical protein
VSAVNNIPNICVDWRSQFATSNQDIMGLNYKQVCFPTPVKYVSLLLLQIEQGKPLLNKEQEG